MRKREENSRNGEMRSKKENRQIRNKTRVVYYFRFSRKAELNCSEENHRGVSDGWLVDNRRKMTIQRSVFFFVFRAFIKVSMSVVS